VGQNRSQKLRPRNRCFGYMLWLIYFCCSMFGN
jgi:hypothetical protein